MNVRVGCIARRQVTMGGFALEATPSSPPVASDSEFDEDDDDEDARHLYPLSLVTKMGSNFGYESSHS